ESRALQEYEIALKQAESGTTQYYLISGEVNYSKGKVQDAVADYAEALKLDPDNYIAHNKLGWILLQLSGDGVTDQARALPHNEKAYSLHVDANTIENLALNYSALDRYAEALPLYEQLLKMEPENGGAHYRAAGFFKAQGNHAEAERLYKLALVIQEK